MKMYRLLVSAFVATFVYVMISMIGGSNGYYANQQLQEQKRVLSAEAARIQGIKEALKLECAALDKDPDVISAYARKLGFVREGEKIVKISGLKPFGDHKYDFGNTVHYTQSYALPEWFCKICGIISFFAVNLVIYLNSLRNKRISQKVVVVKEVPIYDLPQV